MVKGLFAGAVCLIVFSFADAQSIVVKPSLWQPLAAGIEFREFFLPDPNHLYVVRMDRDNPNIILETSLANGSLNAGLETVTDQVIRYDQAINNWKGSWGDRNHIVAAINGGFYNTETGLLANGLVQSGWYIKRFEDRQSVGGFAWSIDREAFIFECLIQRPGNQQIVLKNTGESIRFNGINMPRTEDQVILYTAHWGPQTPPSKQALEILIELDQSLGLFGDPEAVSGTVRQASLGEAGTYLPFDHVVISAEGQPAEAMKDKFSPGTRIVIHQEIRHMDTGCKRERQPAMNGLYTALAGGNIFLRDGQVQPLNDLGSVLRNPRTAVALNDPFIYFIVVDGRDQLRSLGMSMVELALFSRLYLDAQWGVAMDGGGSSTLVINGAVVNNPNAETTVQTPAEKQTRAVANGLMMVNVEPDVRSHRYRSGDAVSIISGSDANLRLGPGTNYSSQWVIPSESQGIVLSHPLNGVLAKGYSWWKVAFQDRTGWISESVIIPVE